MIDTTLLERESKSQRLVDVADGFLALAQTPQLDIATLDIGSGSLVSIRDIVQELTLVTGSRVSAQFGALPDRPLESTRVAKVEDRFAKTCWKPCVSTTAKFGKHSALASRRIERSPEGYQVSSG